MPYLQINKPSCYNFMDALHDMRLPGQTKRLVYYSQQEQQLRHNFLDQFPSPNFYRVMGKGSSNACTGSGVSTGPREAQSFIMVSKQACLTLPRKDALLL